MKEIPLSKGYVAWVDDEDFERCNQYKWTASVKVKTVYAHRQTYYRLGNTKVVYLHRFILDAPDGIQVDHRDLNGLNCQKANLRYATKSQNAINTSIWRTNRSGYRGVSWVKKNKKWRAYIVSNYKQYNLGSFSDLKEAARAYDDKARELHGEFARLNFP